MKRIFIIATILFFSTEITGQFSFTSNASKLIGLASYSPQNPSPGLIAFRYLPGLKLEYQLDTFSKIDFHYQANLNSTISFAPQSVAGDVDVSSYRAYIRYTSKKIEIRVGLQQIEFGPSVIFRPMQWFNQIDPRDPLGLTNGVYGLLTRYYFQNNVNLWIWGLYGNSGTKGYEFLDTREDRPEFGSRLQLPLKNGEIAVNYHFREVDLRLLQYPFAFGSENRIGLDGKWDLGVGLWFEAVHNASNQPIGNLKHTNSFTVGLDYTFGVGNGLNAKAEYLLFQSSEAFISDSKPAQVLGVVLAYPFGLFDSISSVFSYNFVANTTTAFLSYEHQFANVSGYLMLFYNPSTQNGLIQNDLLFNFEGPGIRVMAVYNH